MGGLLTQEGLNGIGRGCHIPFLFRDYPYQMAKSEDKGGVLAVPFDGDVTIIAILRLPTSDRRPPTHTFLFQNTCPGWVSDDPNHPCIELYPNE